MDLDTAQKAVGLDLPSSTFQFTDQDVMLYALGVGCGAEDLPFVYEKGLKVLPTFGVIPAFPALFGIAEHIEFNPVMLVHGGQRIDLRAPIPTSGTLSSQGKITAVYDKRTFAVVVVEVQTTDEQGNLLFTNTSEIILRGEGGFGGDRGPSSSGKNVPPPDRDPKYQVEYKTSPNQAALYRLSGDRNPLHIDPEFAKLAGFDQPILHGLCTFGIVGRVLLNTVCEGDTLRLRDFEARFSGEVYPGETVITQIWKESLGRYIIQVTVEERNAVVIKNAAATIFA